MDSNNQSVQAERPEIVRQTDTQLIPAVDLSGLEQALAHLKKEEALIPELHERAKLLEVKDKESFAVAGALRQQVRSIVKMGEERMGPFKQIIKRASEFISNTVKEHSLKAYPTEEILNTKMNAYIVAENKAAAEEQAKINKGKPPEKRVEVKPNVPTIAGARRHTVYGFEVEDSNKLLNAWARATGNEKAYLRQFVTVNVTALGQEARDKKDPKALMKRIPGVRFTQEERA